MRPTTATSLRWAMRWTASGNNTVCLWSWWPWSGWTVVKNLKAMARMGVYLEQCVQRCYPDFPMRSGVHSWEDYLPPLSPNLRRLVEPYEGVTEAQRHEEENGKREKVEELKS